MYTIQALGVLATTVCGSVDRFRELVASYQEEMRARAAPVIPRSSTHLPLQGLGALPILNGQSRMRHYKVMMSVVCVFVSCCSPKQQNVEESMSLSVLEMSRTPLDFEAGSTVRVLDNRLIVVDRHAAQLVILGADGRTTKLGTKGEGPGEFQSIADIVEVPGDGFWVLDVGRHAGIRLSRDGDFIEEIALPGLPLVARATPDGGLKGIWVLGMEVFIEKVGGEVGKTLPRRDVPAALPSLLSTLSPGAAPLTGGTWTADSTLILAAPGRYELIELREDLTVVRRIARDLPPEFPSEDDLAALRESMETAIKSTNVSVPRAVIDQAVADRSQEPKPPLVLSAIEADGVDRLWVLTSRRRGNAGVIDVFSADRRFLTSVAVPGRPRALTVSGDSLFVLTRDATGIDVLVEYLVSAE